MSDEDQYLALIRDLLVSGVPRNLERTGQGTLAKFGAQCRYQLFSCATGVPILPLFTTKFVSFRNVWTELYFFLKGKTHVNWLRKNKCHIWDGNSSREFLDAHGLAHYPEGQLGPVYGAQWRHFGGTYLGADPETGDSKYAPCEDGIDQLKQVIHQLKHDPESRRHLVVSWNPTDLPKMALPPCHALFQFFVEPDPQGGKPWLSCQMYQRSADMGLGVPYNVASYSILTHLMAHLVGMRAKEFIHVLGDYHIYQSHREGLEQQCLRQPLAFPTVHIRQGLTDLDDLELDDVTISRYDAHPPIKLNMAV